MSATLDPVTTSSDPLARVESLRAIVDSLHANVVVADPTFRIVYLNDRALDSLLAMERDLQSSFSLSVDEVIGASLRRFVPDPSAVDLLTSRGRHELSFSFAGRTFQAVTSPVVDGAHVVAHVLSCSEVVAADDSARELAENAAAVIKVLEAVGNQTTRDGVVLAALDTVRAEFGWAYGSFWALDRATRDLRFSFQSGSVNPEFQAVTEAASFARGVGLSGRAWAQKDLVFVPDLAQVTDCVRAPVAGRAGVKSGVCFPVVVHEEVVGTMDFFALETLELSEGRLDALRSVGRSVSAAVDRVAAADAAKEMAQNAGAVTKVLEAVSREHSRQAVVVAALNTVRAEFGWAYGSFWQRSDETDDLRFSVQSGSVNSEFQAVTEAASFAKGTGLSGRSWQQKDLVFVKDLAQVTDCVRAPVAGRAGVKSGVCFPIVVEGDVVGTMDFFALETLELSEGRLDALRSVGRSVSGAVERVVREDRERTQAEELRSKVDSMLDVVNAAASGDLTREVTVSGDDAIGQMGEALSRFLTDLRSSIQSIASNAEVLAAAAEELQSVSDQMGTTAAETSTQAGVVTTASHEVNRSVGTVSTGVEEMNASIQEIAKSSSEAARVASTAVDAAAATNATVGKLGASSAEIGKIIKVITSIAQQTNLLALNATIEAARAGEAGKGFAVVAGEVKELAKATAEASGDISLKIEAIQADTNSAVGAIEEISTIIEQISHYQNTIASAVEEQAVTTNEIARSVTEASEGSAEITENITLVAKAAEGTASGASDSQRAATELARMASALQTLIGSFTY